jgi:hypothetical protein
MGMHVNKTGRDVKPGGINHAGINGSDPSDGPNAAVFNSYIGSVGCLAGSVVNGPSFYNQLIFPGALQAGYGDDQKEENPEG